MVKIKTTVDYTTTTTTNITKEKIGNNTIISDNEPETSQSIVRSVETFSLDDDGNWISNNDKSQVTLASTIEGEGLVNGDGFYFDNDFDTMVSDKNMTSHDHHVTEMSQFLGDNGFGSAYSRKSDMEAN